MTVLGCGFTSRAVALIKTSLKCMIPAIARLEGEEDLNRSG